jgi:hypothetical protein
MRRSLCNYLIKFMKAEQVYIDVASSLVFNVKTCYLATYLVKNRLTITEQSTELMVEEIFDRFVSEVMQELERIKPEGMQLFVESKTRGTHNN